MKKAVVLIAFIITFLTTSTALLASVQETYTPRTRVIVGVAPFSNPTGDVVITLQSTPLNTGVPGAVFDIFTINPLFPALPDMLVASLTTNASGVTEQVELPIGYYLLIQRASPVGYEPFTQDLFIEVRENQLLNILIHVNPAGTGTTPPGDGGRLLIIARVALTNDFIQGLNFEIRSQLDEDYFGTITTDSRGEASMFLPPGLYFLRQVTAPPGFNLDETRFNFTIWEDRVTTVNRMIMPLGDGGGEGDGIGDDAVNVQDGRLLIILRSADTGDFLNGGKFEIRETLSDSIITTVTTNHFGEASVFVPPGMYFVRAILPPRGYELDSERINVSITAGALSTVNITKSPLEQPEPPAPDEVVQAPIQGNGRIFVTVREQGGQERLIENAVFDIIHTLTNRHIGQITTNEFGDASALLPSGNYTLRQISVPSEFRLNPERIRITINNDAVSEITIYNRLERDVALGIALGGTEGRLLFMKSAADTGLPLSGSTLEVRRVADDAFMGVIVTDRHGEASLSLMPGDYFLRETQSPVGFMPNPDRISFRITTGAITVIEDISEQITGANDPTQGRLLLTVINTDGERLQNTMIAIHHIMTDELIETLVTNEFGETSMFLPVGNYYFRVINVPFGNRLNPERVNFSINPADMTDLIIMVNALPAATPPPIIITEPEPPPPIINGRIEIVTRAANSGNLIMGGLFGIYRDSDSRLVGQTTVGENGIAYFYVPPGIYFVRELRPTFGFLIEEESMFVEVTLGSTVRIELTKNRDYTIPVSEIDPATIILLPEMGQARNSLFYIGSVILFSISGVLLLLFIYSYVSQLIRSRKIAVQDVTGKVVEVNPEKPSFSLKKILNDFAGNRTERKKDKIREEIKQRRNYINR